MAMTRRVATTIAGTVLLGEVCLIAGIAWVDASLVRRGYDGQFSGLNEPLMWMWPVAILVPGAVALVIVRSHPRHAVGWLFLVLSTSIMASGVVEEWFTLAAIVEPAELGGAGTAATLADKSFLPWWPLLTLILLLTPTGTYASPRWRLVGRTTVVASIVFFVFSLVSSKPLTAPYDQVGNPWTVSAIGDVATGLAQAAFVVVAIGLLLGGWSLVQRWRLSTGDTRRQLLWLALVVVPLPAVIPVHLYAVGTGTEWLLLGTLALFLALIPIAAGLSVLRYRLYDVDRIVATTFTYSFLSFGLAVVYASVVWLGSQVTTAATPSPATTATVGAVTAATLAAPMRGEIQRRVDRRFNRRAFEAVRMVRDAVTVDRAGVDAEALIRTALADSSVRVAYPVGDGWVDGNGALVDEPDVHVDVTRGDRTVARIGYDPAQADESTVARAGKVAAAELDNTRLRAELQRHLAELADSRARIAEAQRAERRRIERDLHDGAQQSLLALAFQLQSAHLNGDPERMSAALRDGAGSARDAVRQLRDLANGLHPPALTEAGLTAVLDDLARWSPVPMRITCPPDRFLPSVEFTCWLVIAEAVVNAHKHAAAQEICVEVREADGVLSVGVRDDGRGGADQQGGGLRGMRDRVEAAGGRLHIRSGPDGTTIEAEIPCAS